MRKNKKRNSTDTIGCLGLFECGCVFVTEVKVKPTQVVPWSKREELNPSLVDSRSNCKRLSSIWYPSITIDVFIERPPFIIPKHHKSASSLVVLTIEFDPVILQTASGLCITRSMVGTLGPIGVLVTSFAS